MFVILLNLLVIRNLRATCSSVEMLKGNGQRKVGTLFYMRRIALSPLETLHCCFTCVLRDCLRTTTNICSVQDLLRRNTYSNQGCSGAGTRGNGVPTPFLRFALKWVGNYCKMAIFWLRSHNIWLALHPWLQLSCLGHGVLISATITWFRLRPSCLRLQRTKKGNIRHKNDDVFYMVSGQLPPGKLPPDNCHLGPLPLRTTAT